ncbi:MAG: glutaredoxin family protein [Cyanobacteria bacterium]|nr:glutaredoxin family protein [Cyanobacteria bacterium CG_2015-16_32_12]NCO78859.1 glutaredoxin family protein [Cyanobacteria bacterium CG_2015-22_32_23]NCQ05100.1 glutaredoxin family protein [Cyanobacteria bacterium CG_2015-09_32_10]NCQ42570.1 glutaredoxin family protein [Cyanobacteria bacterium CG_2015-04_32_10]NCS85385.1 glutaredoxin family protein [Cyanobacteria bacterium CG_2015-02_32_10]
MKIILYSKLGCHLCEGLEEKLKAITDMDLDIEIRDISTNNQWWEMYQYEIPVLFLSTTEGEKLIPRPSPRISVVQLTKILRNCVQNK